MAKDPLLPNPGGQLDPDEIVGREAELATLIEAVSRGPGAHVTGERRMGKTMLLRKLVDNLADVAVISISAETSRLDVVEKALLAELSRHRPVRQWLARWDKEAEAKVNLTILGTGIMLRGKASRTAAEVEVDVLDLLTQAGPVVLIIDEITVLCQHLGEDAREFLRSLRRLRHSDRAVPLVLAGSIGLHHVLTDSTPINELWPVSVGPLTGAEADELVSRLFAGVDLDGSPQLRDFVVEVTSGIPFYIHALVNKLRSLPARPQVTPALVDDLLERMIADNDLHTRHFIDRLPEYYGSQAGVAREVLDRFAVATAPLTVQGVRAELIADGVPDVPDRHAMIDLFAKLALDHYIVRDASSFRMSSPLLARIWRIHESL